MDTVARLSQPKLTRPRTLRRENPARKAVDGVGGDHESAGSSNARNDHAGTGAIDKAIDEGTEQRNKTKTQPGDDRKALDAQAATSNPASRQNMTRGFICSTSRRSSAGTLIG